MQKQSFKPIVQPQQVKSLRYQTPYFLLSKNELLKSLKEYKQSFPGADIYYAMKANSEPEVLKLIRDQGVGFEVASTYELGLLRRIRVHHDKIIYGTAIKPIKHIKAFVKFGVSRFAFDSEQELEKLSKYAPGSRVYVRVLVRDSAKSVFKMSEKFGTSPKDGVSLLIKAKTLGLIPYGISFNVGSQATNPHAWENGVNNLAPYINQLRDNGIKLEMINLGGGFPQSYSSSDGISTVQEIAEYTNNALKKLPADLKVLIEPGRGIIAHPMVLIVSVIAKIKRNNGYWLYLDGGAYNALLESMAYQGTTRYRVTPLKGYASKAKQEFILTGPTGDNLDIITRSEVLPKDISIGDKLIIHDTGAYSLVLTTPFNGFPKPKVHNIEKG